MSNSKDLVSTTWSPGFIDKFLPSSQQVSLLYHLSYLCLGKFPKLERLLRMRCVETQMLFGSSEAVMMKCMGTSNNLVTSLFPMLIIAIEKDKPVQAVKYLEKARMWITDIIRDVDIIVKRYETLNRDVATTRNDVSKEKEEAENAQEKVAQENQQLKEAIKELEKKLHSCTAEIEAIKRQMEVKDKELQDEVTNMTSKSFWLTLLAIVIPFFGVLIKILLEGNYDSESSAKIKGLQAELRKQYDLKMTKRQEEWDLQVQLIDKQMILSKNESDKGIIPKASQLKDVQKCLDKIVKILRRLKEFWETVLTFLNTIKEKTFVNEDQDQNDPDFKEGFVKSIHEASKQWENFGEYCNKAVKMFRTQTQDAYDFLDIDLDTISEEEWQKEYDSVKKQLENLQVSGIPANKAITN